MPGNSQSGDLFQVQFKFPPLRVKIGLRLPRHPDWLHKRAIQTSKRNSKARHAPIGTWPQIAPKDMASQRQARRNNR
jgi:hypothetical protein